MVAKRLITSSKSIESFNSEAYSETYEISEIKIFAKMVNGRKPFQKKLHLRCLTGFRKRTWKFVHLVYYFLVEMSQWITNETNTNQLTILTFSCKVPLSVFSPNARKYGPEKTPYLDTIHAVYCFVKKSSFYSLQYTKPGITCDLLREKGPTAIKRRFKTQLTAFSL